MNTKKLKIIFFCLFTVLALQVSLPALAASSGNTFNPWGDDSKKNAIQETTGLGERDPRNIAASIINVALGFLGIIAVGLILYGGFKWMTAGGNEDQVGEAKKIIIAGVIGLIIILSAFALANFVLNQLIRSTT